MSHGPAGGDGIRVDPDLTPMLDLVMQLLMYFIMCAQFVGEELPGNVKLPYSQEAQPIAKGEDDWVFMNINEEGKIIVLGEPPMDMDRTTSWLNDRIREAPKDDKGSPRSLVVIRADERAGYASIFELMQKCKEKKFSRFAVRAIH
jgi:biopolymer transport protein ExbD